MTGGVSVTKLARSTRGREGGQSGDAAPRPSDLPSFRLRMDPSMHPTGEKHPCKPGRHSHCNRSTRDSEHLFSGLPSPSRLQAVPAILFKLTALQLSQCPVLSDQFHVVTHLPSNQSPRMKRQTEKIPMSQRSVPLTSSRLIRCPFHSASSGCGNVRRSWPGDSELQHMC